MATELSSATSKTRRTIQQVALLAPDAVPFSLQIQGFASADAMDPVVHLCSCAAATVTPLGERRRRPR
jgi:hypothetical protein